ncbi:MAG: hypothetical protein BGP16_00285 [Sphingobium sp. 66-54]|nr:MAG: hypothetical protein BGP16_00285 [Sphingobium sp. 66-54]
MGAVSWTARDWRQFSALMLMALAAIPLTAIMAASLWIVHLYPRNHYAFWLGQSAAALIALDLIGLSAILGRRTFKIRVGDKELDMTGEDAERVLSTGDAA